MSFFTENLAIRCSSLWRVYENRS